MMEACDEIYNAMSLIPIKLLGLHVLTTDEALLTLTHQNQGDPHPQKYIFTICRLSIQGIRE